MERTERKKQKNKHILNFKSVGERPMKNIYKVSENIQYAYLMAVFGRKRERAVQDVSERVQIC